MSGIELKRNRVELPIMSSNEQRFRVGIALLVLAGALLFAPTALGVLEAFAGLAAALAVLGLAGSAVLIGTAGDGRPV